MPASPAYKSFKKHDKKCAKKGKLTNPSSRHCVSKDSRRGKQLINKAATKPAKLKGHLVKDLAYSPKEATKVIKTFVDTTKKDHHHHAKSQSQCEKDLEIAVKLAERQSKELHSLRKRLREAGVGEPAQKRAKAAAIGAFTVADAINQGIIEPSEGPGLAAHAAAAASTGTQMKEMVKAAAFVVADEADVHLSQKKIDSLVSEIDQIEDRGQHKFLHRISPTLQGMLLQKGHAPHQKELAGIKERLAAEKHPFTARRKVKQSTCKQFVFVFGAGASAAKPASIPTFRGNTGKTSEILVAAVRAAEKYYPEIVDDNRDDAELVVVKDQKSGEVKSRLPWSAVFIEKFRTKYPKIINGIWAYWIDAVKGKHPNLAHHVAAEMLKRGMLNRVISMNVDNLEYAAGLPMESVVLEHGSVFVGRDHDIRAYHSSKHISPKDQTSVVTVNGTVLPDDDLVKEQLLPDIKNACLVFVGVSGAIVPEWIFDSKPAHIIVVDPKKGAVSEIMRGFPDDIGEKEDMWDVFEDMEDFVKHIIPDFKMPTGFAGKNDDKAAVKKAVDWISKYASDFPFDE